MGSERLKGDDIDKNVNESLVHFASSPIYLLALWKLFRSSKILKRSYVKLDTYFDISSSSEFPHCGEMYLSYPCEM